MENSCPFCDREKIGADRIIHETESFVVAATLGQITDGGHIMIISTNHIPCMAELSDSLINDLGWLIFNTREALQKEYGIAPTMFEHGIVGQTVKHAHFHLLPANLDFTDGVRRDFPTAKLDRKTPHHKPPYVSYRQNPEPYLFWNPSGHEESYVCWNPPAEPQYFRTLSAKMLGRPERANWRNVDPKADKKLIDETVAKLKPHFV